MFSFAVKWYKRWPLFADEGSVYWALKSLDGVSPFLLPRAASLFSDIEKVEGEKSWSSYNCWYDICHEKDFILYEEIVPFWLGFPQMIEFKPIKSAGVCFYFSKIAGF